MKKILLWLMFILAVSGIGFAACLPIIKRTKDLPVSKTVSFALYKESNYSSKAYKKSSAQIDIIIEKVRKENRSIVWDTTIDTKLLSKYPLFKKAVAKTVIIPNVYENKEHLEMTYFLIYNSNGSILKLPGERYLLNNISNISISL